VSGSSKGEGKRGGFRKHTDLLEKLGKYKSGGGCLYLKRLEDVDPGVLKQLIARSVKSAKSGDWSYGARTRTSGPRTHLRAPRYGGQATDNDTRRTRVQICTNRV
jgi:hypothetical protein